MNLLGRFLTGIIVIAMVTMLAGAAFAASGGHMPGMGSNNTSVNNNADRDSFIALWKKVFAAGSFTAEQTKRLTTELEVSAKKLAENYTALNAFLEQQKAANGSNTDTIQKRIDLKEAERDLIVSQSKLKLEEFLTKEQVNLILMAGFHGISLSQSGEEHLNNLHGGMNQQMGGVEQQAMDLGKLAEKLNQNCQAVTLELIRSNLGM